MNQPERLVPSPQRSTFVTVLAWIFIVLAGFTTFISILQNIMISVMFPVEEMNQAFNNPQVSEEIPAFARFMFSNIHLFFLAILAVSTTTFVSSIGLLKRKNWARIIFIAIMCLGIAWNILALIFQQTMFKSMPGIPAGDIDSQFQTIMLVVKIFTFIMVIGFSILFGWIIKKLSSKKIKAEFITQHLTEERVPIG